MNNIYTEGKYLVNNPGWHMEDSPWKAKKISRMIKRNSISIKSIAEIGCGGGEILNQLSKSFTDVEMAGFEISPQAFALCEQKKKTNLNFFLKNMLEEDVFFDLALCMDIIEHVENPFEFLRKLRNKASYHIFHIPIEITMSAALRKKSLIDSYEKVGHLHYFSGEIALHILRDCGYEVVDYFFTPGASELPSVSVKKNILKFPRKILFLLNPDLAVRTLGGCSIMILTNSNTKNEVKK